MTIDECREMVDRMFVVDKIAMKGYK